LRRGVGASNRRQSCAFFFNANADAVIETFDSCLKDSGESRYEPVIAGEYLLRKHDAAAGTSK